MNSDPQVLCPFLLELGHMEVEVWDLGRNLKTANPRREDA